MLLLLLLLWCCYCCDVVFPSWYFFCSKTTSSFSPILALQDRGKKRYHFSATLSLESWVCHLMDYDLNYSQISKYFSAHFWAFVNFVYFYFQEWQNFRKSKFTWKYQVLLQMRKTIISWLRKCLIKKIVFISIKEVKKIQAKSYF